MYMHVDNTHNHTPSGKGVNSQAQGNPSMMTPPLLGHTLPRVPNHRKKLPLKGGHLTRQDTKLSQWLPLKGGHLTRQDIKLSQWLPQSVVIYLHILDFIFSYFSTSSCHTTRLKLSPPRESAKNRTTLFF